MIIFTKEALENNEYIIDIIKKEKQLINYKIESQESLKNILLQNMQKLADSTDIIDVQLADTILEILNDFKKSLELFKINIDLLNQLLESLSNISLKISDNYIETITNFNTTFFDSFETISKNTIEIENVLYSVLPFYEFTFLESNNISVENNTSIQDILKKELLEMPTDNKKVQTIEDSSIIENTLIISETKGKVFLPYTIDSLNDILKNNSDKYSNIEEVIESEYTLPFDIFKNPAVARFREAFKLIRQKENGSIKEAFDLGMELLFNYNLHPSIISACKNLDELDIYLDYLENNETQKFDFFKIVFDIAPVIVKKNKRN